MSAPEEGTDKMQHPVSGCLEVARNQRFCAGAEAAAAEILELRKALAESRAETKQLQLEKRCWLDTDLTGQTLLAQTKQITQLENLLTAATERARSAEGIIKRTGDLTAELRRYYGSGLFEQTTDLYLLLNEVEAVSSAFLEGKQCADDEATKAFERELEEAEQRRPG